MVTLFATNCTKILINISLMRTSKIKENKRIPLYDARLKKTNFVTFKSISKHILICTKALPLIDRFTVFTVNISHNPTQYSGGSRI